MVINLQMVDWSEMSQTLRGNIYVSRLQLSGVFTNLYLEEKSKRASVNLREQMDMILTRHI